MLSRNKHRDDTFPTFVGIPFFRFINHLYCLVLFSVGTFVMSMEVYTVNINIKSWVRFVKPSNSCINRRRLLYTGIYEPICTNMTKKNRSMARQWWKAVPSSLLKYMSIKGCYYGIAFWLNGHCSDGGSSGCELELLCFSNFPILIGTGKMGHLTDRLFFRGGVIYGLVYVKEKL